MRALDYDRLTKITLNQSPYRGTKNKFPIGSRTQSNKYFLVDEENGQTIYRVIYGKRWEEYPITKDEYDSKPYLHERSYYNITWRKDDDPMRYVRAEVLPRELGVVRPDNTFEFTAKYYGQGDNTVMSGWGKGYFCRDARRGGMIYRSGYGEGQCHPIFNGLRVNCETMQSVTPYQVFGKRVMRKVGKELISGYEDFYKTNEVMLKAMDYKTFVGLAKDVFDEAVGDEYQSQYWLSDSLANHLLVKAKELEQSSSLDSAILYLIGLRIDDMWSRIKNANNPNSYYSSKEIDLSSTFDKLKRKLNTQIYRANPDVFKDVEHEHSKLYPASQWGVTILVDGKEVEQY